MIEPIAIREAYERINGLVHRTPVVTCATLDREAGCRVFLKCENFQRVGAFKFRGACNAVSQLTDDERKRGVVTHSSGNHAQALALAARMHGVRCWVVMPTDAPEVKRRATEGYGAEIIPCEPTVEAREAAANRVVEEKGAVLIPPYDHDHIIAGQGTAAWELFHQVRELTVVGENPGGEFIDLEAILAPVGGGGLLAGTALAARLADVELGKMNYDAADTVVYGCEPTQADDAYRSFKSGERVKKAVPSTIADGLRTTLGVRNFEIIQRDVEDIVLVSEEEIVEAMRFIWERAKIIIEPSSAVAVAPLLFRKIDSLSGANVGVILSGGNVDATEFFNLLRDRIT